MAFDYATRNNHTTPLCIRLPNDVVQVLNAHIADMGIGKSQIFSRLLAAYLSGRLGAAQVDLPPPSTSTQEYFMAAAAKKTVAKKTVKPVAKAKAPAKKK